jgi:hypothetical protein
MRHAFKARPNSKAAPTAKTMRLRSDGSFGMMLLDIGPCLLVNGRSISASEVALRNAAALA